MKESKNNQAELASKIRSLRNLLREEKEVFQKSKPLKKVLI